MFHKLRRSLAKLWLDVNLQLTIIGVTGSYGKTNTVRAIAEVLSSKFSVNSTDLNLDTIFNLPITILKTKPWNEILVLEYGIDHKKEMDFHLSLVKPKIAVLTGITPVHSDKEHLGSLESIILEKTKLVEAIPEDGLAIFNYDDQYSKKIGEDFKKRKKFYGINKRADIWAENVKISTEGTSFILHNKNIKHIINTQLLGFPSVHTCLVAYIIGNELKINDEDIVKALSCLRPLKGRLSLESGPLGTIIFNDSLRANPVSTIAGLKSFSEFSGKKIVVLGEMGELGDFEESSHRSVGKEVSKLKIDYLVGVGPLTKFVIDEALKNGFDRKKTYYAKDVLDASNNLRTIIKKNDLIYLKASLLRHLERILILLEGKEVCCDEIVCHRYQSCDSCGQLLKRLK